MSRELEQKIEELEAELQYYRGLFAEPKDELAGPLRKLGFWPREIKVIALFLKRMHVSKETILAALGEDFSESYPQVIIHSLRQKLTKHDIKIKTIRSFGWIMEQDSRERLAALTPPKASPPIDPLRAAFNRAKLRGL